MMATRLLFFSLVNNSSSRTEMTCLLHCIKLLGEVITLRRKRLNITKVIEMLNKIFINFKKFSPQQFEEKKNREKLMTVISKRGSFPIEYAALRGFHLLDLSDLANVHGYVIFCNVVGANAIELGLFDIAVEMFSLASQFIQENNFQSKKCICLTAIIENNMGCAQSMMGNKENWENYLQIFAKNLQKLQYTKGKDKIRKCLCYSKLYLLDSLRNNLARILIDSNQVDKGLSMLSETFFVKLFEFTHISKVNHNVIGDQDKEEESFDERKSRDYVGSLAWYEEPIGNGDARMASRFDSCAAKSEVDMEPGDQKVLLPVLGTNYAAAHIEKKDYVKAQKVLEYFSTDKDIPQLWLLNSLLLVLVKVLQGLIVKTENVFVTDDLNLAKNSLTEKSFRPWMFIYIQELSRILALKGQRKQSKEWLERAINTSEEVCGINHNQTTSLKQTFNELFPVVPEIPHSNPEELSKASLKEVIKLYKDDVIMHTFNNRRAFLVNLETEYQMLLSSCEDDLDELPPRWTRLAEEILKSSLITCLGQESIDDKDVYSIVKVVRPSAVLTRAANPMQLTWTPLLYSHNISALCFLLETMLTISSLETISLICRNLVELITLYQHNLGSEEEETPIEFYKDLDGLLSVFVSYRQLSICRVPTSLLTIATCGRQLQSSDDDACASKQPLFKRIDLKENDSLETNEKPLQSVNIVCLKSSDLIDIEELRKIDERNLKSVSLVSPLDVIVTEVVPDISRFLTKLPNGFDLLEKLLKTSSGVECIAQDQATNEHSLYAHFYQKQCIFVAETEPEVYTTVLHQQLTLKDLVETCNKTRKKTKLIFKNPQHGLLTIVSKELSVNLYLEVLSPDPSGSSVVPNDITKLTDKILEKCQVHFGISVNSNHPWNQIDVHSAELVDLDNDVDELQSVLAAKRKLEEENNGLKNKVRQLTECCEELQDNRAPDFLTPIDDQEHTSTVYLRGNGADRGRSISLGDQESTQTNSLSMEYQIDEQTLREIGEAEFHRERAERDRHKFVTIPQDLWNFKRRTGPSQINQPTEEPSASDSIQAADRALALQIVDTVCENKFISKNITENMKESAQSSERTRNPTADMIKGHSSDNDGENETPFEKTSVASNNSSLEIDKFYSLTEDEGEKCTSQTFHNHGKSTFETSPDKSELASDYQPDSIESQDDCFAIMNRNDELQSQDHGTRSTDTMEEVTADGSSDPPIMPKINDLSDLEQADEQNCHQDSNPHFFSQPVNCPRTSKITHEYFEKLNSTEMQNGLKSLSDEAVSDMKRSTRGKYCVVTDGPMLVKTPSNAIKDEIIAGHETDSSNKCEIESRKYVIADGPSFVKGRAIDINCATSAGQSENYQVKSRDIIPKSSRFEVKNIDAMPVVHSLTDTKVSTSSHDDRERKLDPDAFCSLPLKLTASSLSLQNSEGLSKDTKLSSKSHDDGENGSAGLDKNEICSSSILSSQNSAESHSLSQTSEKHSKPKSTGDIHVHQNVENKEIGSNVLDQKHADYPQHRPLFKISEIDASGNVPKHNPAWNFIDDQVKQSNGEPLGIDRSFLSRHSRDSTLNQGVFHWRRPGNSDYLSLPLFNHTEDSLWQNDYGVLGYKDTLVKQVSPCVICNPQVTGNGENTEHQFLRQPDKYKSSSEVNHVDQAFKLPFPSEYMLPKIPTTRVHGNKSVSVFPSRESNKPSFTIERQLNRTSAMGSDASSSKSSELIASAASNTSSKPLVSDVSNINRSEKIGSLGSHNNCSEPVGPDVSCNESSESLTSGIVHISTEPIASVVSNHLPTESRYTELSTGRMESDDSHNMPSVPKESGISDISNERIPIESIRPNLSNNAADLPSSSSMMAREESRATEDGTIKSLEEAVSRYKATCTSLMEESMRKALKLQREQKRKKEQEEIDKKLELRRQKESENDSLRPAKLPIQESLSDSESSCQHFKRGCDVLFPCCSMYFPCHRCHNSSDQCEQNESKAADATKIRCRTCMTEQEITSESHHCKNCKKKLSEYFCAICKHFTADDKKPYHCEPCGICRIHRENSFHCDVCNVCLNQRLKGKHKCRPDSGHDECCICLEDAFSGCQVLPCSHKVHRDCAVAMLKNGVKTCPICRSPIYQN